MLTDWLLDHLQASQDRFWVVLGDKVPPPPGWAAQGPFYVDEVLDKAASFDSWVPVSLAGPVIFTIGVCIVLGLALKLVRILLSYATLGGGSAG